MTLQSIEIQNYRCFDHLSLDFKPKINLLVGDNASGKTSLIKVLSTILSSFFVGYSDDNTRFLSLSKKDFQEKISHLEIAVNAKPIEIRFNMLDKKAAFYLTSEKSRTSTKDLTVLKIYAADLQKTLFDNDKNQCKALPLFAKFSTENIHSNRKLSGEIFKRYYHKPSFGYYECLSGDGLFRYWKSRMLVLKEGEKKELELEVVRQAINTTLGSEGCNIIEDISIRPNQKKVYYIFTDGREIEADNLSDGYARLVNIITNLAFRCALLNGGIYGYDAALKTEGTVLIDEIDLHLHPQLQTVVLKGLTNAFPKLQFIVTTHAPMIMSGVETNDENAIFKLSYTEKNGYVIEPIQLYGLDASTIIETAQHTIPRDKKVDDRLSQLFDYIDNEKFSEATDLLSEMKSIFNSTLPELSKAETLLNLYSENDNENDSEKP